VAVGGGEPHVRDVHAPDGLLVELLHVSRTSKVIALDFFAQFPRHALLDSPAAMRYRRTVLEPGGSMPGREIVHQFLGRSQSSDAFTEWIGEEFQAMSAAYVEGSRELARTDQVS
jgi:hypothetical protein